ncbi:MAG TPA: DUF932 domain-containing protein [Verrucomicrobiota bacterium]|nr:DUF932 domain-containing protein [Verrucomicrobiota bacterium]
MPFHYEQNPRLSFDSFASLCDSAEKEKQSLERRSLRELLHRGARFYDDHSFGHPGEGLQFNEEGLHSFCRLMRVPFALTTGIERAGLSTDLLNDVLGRNTIQQELGNHDLVTDTRTGLIVGVVSCSYVTYSNRDLLDDLDGLVKRSGKDGRPRLNFESGHMLNTKLRVRFRTELQAGVVRGRGGTADDKTIIGFQFVNSMTGDTAIRIDFYLHRLICANGIIAPVSQTENVVFHSGREANFLNRLDRRFHAVTRSIDNAVKQWQRLATIDFNPQLLAKAGFTSDILDLCGEQRDELRKVGSDLKLPEDMPREEKRLRRETAVIDAIPKRLATGGSARVFQSYWRDNKTLFDFVNLFTERAKECDDLARRIEMEESAGLLADRLFKHRQKLGSN